ncbi:MAG: class I SAM-dependent methyltransferase [bacterium]
MKKERYSETFFKRINTYSNKSAEVVEDLLIKKMNGCELRSVLDIGCGTGVWLKNWEKRGVKEVVGIDNARALNDTLMIDPDAYVTHDLSKEIVLNKQFDLVQSLEVAEHLPLESAAIFIQNIIRHGKVVLFSAAVPGQGGTHHINEQPLSYWFELFQKHNFEAYDCIRPYIINDKRVEYYYRNNILLYIHKSVNKKVTLQLEKYKVSSGSNIKDFSTMPYKIRKKIISFLPRKVVNGLAFLKVLCLVKLKR